ncbi:MAG: hypothetical protein U0W24_07150 [Bacteroidales bacterium]
MEKRSYSRKTKGKYSKTISFRIEESDFNLINEARINLEVPNNTGILRFIIRNSPVTNFLKGNLFEQSEDYEQLIKKLQL